MSTRIRSWLVAIGLTTVQAIVGDVAAVRAQEAVPLKREIIALYDGAQEGDVEFTRIHRFAEMPLNHLGFIVRFHDVRTKLPGLAEMERYRGVLTWFASAVPNSNAYLVWASQVSRMNLRYVILGDIGIPVDSSNILAVNRLLSVAGVHHTGDYVAPTLGTRVVQKDQSLIEFECGLGPVLPDYPVINTNGAGTRIGLMLEAPVREGKRNAVLAAIGERGAYAALNYEFCHQRPPLYQGKWLINPFAFFRAALGGENEPIPDTTTASGNRLYFSVLENEGSTRSSKIEDYRDAPITAGEVVLGELIEPFHDLPVTVAQQDEVVRSGRSGKQMQMILQRLLANPNADPLRRRLGATLSRFDSEYPSISNLAPLTAVDPDHVINQPISAETAYYEVGRVGESAFSALRETLANTESPLRLKPFSLGYHAYAGEYPGLLRSVKARLREARSTALTPVSANRYARIVDGFFSARIDRIGSAAWRISNRGELQTVRFDAAEGEVDFRSSIGVIGQRRIGTTLYVALDETIEPVVVFLVPPTLSRSPSRGFVLVESRWLVRNVVKDDCRLSFEAQGYGEGSFTWSDAAPGRYMILADRAGQEIWRHTAEADAAGKLTFVIPAGAVDPVAIRINCVGAARAAER
jgi:hypothetical protein